MALDGELEEATIPPGRELGPVAVVTCADATWLPVRPAPANLDRGSPMSLGRTPAHLRGRTRTTRSRARSSDASATWSWRPPPVCCPS